METDQKVLFKSISYVINFIGKTKLIEISKLHNHFNQPNQISKEVTLTINSDSEPHVKKKTVKSSKRLFFNQNDIDSYNLKKVLSYQPTYSIVNEDDEFPNINPKPNKINKVKLKLKVNSDQKDTTDRKDDNNINHNNTINHFDIYDKPVYNEQKFILPLNTDESVNTMLNEKLNDKNFMKSKYKNIKFIIKLFRKNTIIKFT